MAVPSLFCLSSLRTPLPTPTYRISQVSAQKYREIREGIGSQDVVAKRLGVDKRTIQRRENGGMKVAREAELALYCLHFFCFFARILGIGPSLILVLNGLEFIF